MTPVKDALDARINVALTMSVAPLAQIRQWLATSLADLAADVVGDLLLISTELVSNAYDHAHGPRRLRLHRLDGRSRLRIEVDDASPHRLPVLGRSTLGEHRGRGLLMVDVMSQQNWGVQVLPGGKTVWADVPLSLP